MQTVVAEAPLIGAQVQDQWSLPHATWFTLMGVGGGIFLLARLLGLESRLGLWVGMPVVDLLSFVVIGVGGLILIWHLGRPLRFMRAILRPGTSWISRGAIADFVFLVTGALLVLPGIAVGGVAPFAWLPWEPSPSLGVGKLVEALALVSAAVVIFYAGQVLADARAIPYWASPAIPVQFVLSSLATSMAVVMLLQTLNRVPIAPGEFSLLVVFLALLLLAIAWPLLFGTSVPGKAESLDMLLRGRFRSAFVGGVVVAGTVLPMILAAIGAAAAGLRDVLGVVCLLCTLPAGFALRVLTLRVGVYAPLRACIRLPSR